MNENTTSTSSSTPTEPRDEAALALKSKVAADVHDVRDEAKSVVTGVAAQARKSAESRISGGKTRAADGLGTVAEALRHTGEHLGTRDDLGITDYVTGAADRVEAVSDYLREASLADVLGDVSDFARREPALFLGGAFALGLIGGRFIKASKAESNERSAGASESPSGGQRSARTAGRSNKRGGATSGAGSTSRSRGAHNGDVKQTRPESGQAFGDADRERTGGGMSGAS